jgi:large subunit ribosomal protein L33
MAKKGQRTVITLACVDCKRQNYTSEKSKLNTKDKLEVQKFCPYCKKQTNHKETKS